VEYQRVVASFGHDSFLVEVETMTQLVGGYLNANWLDSNVDIDVDDEDDLAPAANE
jgi:hypothetical protein